MRVFPLVSLAILISVHAQAAASQEAVKPPTTALVSGSATPSRSSVAAGPFARNAAGGVSSLYVFKGIGSGTLGTTPLANGRFVIRLFSNTADITQLSNFLVDTEGPASLSIDGFPTARFQLPTRVFSNTAVSAVGFSRATSIGGIDLLDLFEPDFAGYRLGTPLGPVLELNPLNFIDAIPTCQGPVTFDTVDEVTFEALIPAPIVVDFDTEDDGLTPLANGQELNPGEEFGRLVSIEGRSRSRLGAAVFDSTPNGPNAAGNDPTLLIDQGGLVLLQQDPLQSAPDIYQRPDADPRGGTLVFRFVEPVRPLALDLVGPRFGSPWTITQFDREGDTRVHMLAPRLRAVSSPAAGKPISQETATVQTLDLELSSSGVGSAASIYAATAADFDPRAVIRMEVRFSGAGAVDNLMFQLSGS